MKTAIYTDNIGNQTEITFDDIMGQEIDRVDRSVFYVIHGEDSLGRQYSATSEFCCGEFEGITEIERISHMHHNRKPYQARPLLKSIKYWQSVVNGTLAAKRPLAYYKNKLSYYTKDDIDYLEKLSTQDQRGQAFNFDNEPPII